MMTGMDNMLFWVGVVIANNDLQNAGRVKVRVLGMHDETVQHSDLPWAPVIDGTYGTAFSVPKLGEWVLGAFIDGREGQHPIVLGTMPGYHAQMGQQTQGGDVDANLSIAAQTFGTHSIHPAQIGEGVSRLSGPLLAVATNDVTARDSLDRTFSEVRYQIPDRNITNRVISSQDQQNFIVLSDSDNGLFQVTTASGSVIQIDKEGTIYIKSQGGRNDSTYGSRVDYTEGSHINHVNKGDYLVRVDGPSGGNAKIFVTGDIDIDCENLTWTVRGDANFNIKGSYNLRAADVKQFAYLDNMNLVAAQEMKLQSILPMSLKSFSNLYTESLLDTVMVSGLDTTLTALAGSIEGYASAGIELTSLAGSIDLFSTLSSVNASGLTEVNLNATSVNLDNFVFLASGRSAGKTSATLPDVPASLLGIFAAAPDMPDIVDSYPGGGYKTLDVPSQRFPSSGQSALGTAGAQPLTLTNIGDRIQDIGNQFNRLIS